MLSICDTLGISGDGSSQRAGATPGFGVQAKKEVRAQSRGRRCEVLQARGGPYQHPLRWCTTKYIYQQSRT